MKKLLLSLTFVAATYMAQGQVRLRTAVDSTNILYVRGGNYTWYKLRDTVGTIRLLSDNRIKYCVLFSVAKQGIGKWYYGYRVFDVRTGDEIFLYEDGREVKIKVTNYIDTIIR
jgi:hypothetical protein